MHSANTGGIRPVGISSHICANSGAMITPQNADVSKGALTRSPTLPATIISARSSIKTNGFKVIETKIDFIRTEVYYEKAIKEKAK